MKCPVCSEEFGYLLLKNLEKTKKETLFHCPKCSQKLSNSSLLEIQRKVDFFHLWRTSFLDGSAWDRIHHPR